MKFQLLPSVVFLLLASLIGCDDTSDTGTISGTNAENPAPTVSSKGTIGFSTLTLTNPFFKIIADTMTEDARKHGYEVVVVSGDQDVNRQTAQIEDFIVRGVSAIVLNPCDSKAIGTAIRKANAAGIPVFTNDIRFDGTEGRVECHIATDNYQGGRLAGEAMVKLTGASGGRIAVLHYPDVESCQLRVKGFTEVIDSHNAQEGSALIDIVTTLNGQGAREAGFAAAKDAIEAHPDLVALFAINDPSALGARAALEAAGKAEQVRIIGFDGTIEGKRAILAGQIVCDPIQFPVQMGQTTIEMIVKYFDGEKPQEVVLIPSRLYYLEDARNDPELSEVR
jgi:ribose transport system substrate-binding protein